MIANIEVPAQAIQDFCLKNHIRKLCLFGSVVRDDFTENSDVDVLAEFEPGQTITLFRLSQTEEDLSELLKKKVDLNIPDTLCEYFRQDIEREACVVYEAT